jgi:AcrR family transcriptional regulator
MKDKSVPEKKGKRDKSKRTDQILKAAKTTILSKGFNGATMDDIALEAGITKPTVYQYFKTKDELFLMLLEPLIQSIALQVIIIKNRLLEKHYSSGTDVIDDIFKIFFAIFETDPDRFKLLSVFLQTDMFYHMDYESAESLKSWGRKCFEEGHTISSLCVELGLFKNIDVFKTTDFIWGSFWGIVQVEQYKAKGEPISRHMIPMLEYTKNLLIEALVRK